MPSSIVLVNLGGEKADSCCELGGAVDVLVAGVCKTESVGRSGAIAKERAVVSTELCDIGVGPGAQIR